MQALRRATSLNGLQEMRRAQTPGPFTSSHSSRPTKKAAAPNRPWCCQLKEDLSSPYPAKIRLDHHFHETGQTYAGGPAELLMRLCRVADEEVDFRRAIIF